MSGDKVVSGVEDVVAFKHDVLGELGILLQFSACGSRRNQDRPTDNGVVNVSKEVTTLGQRHVSVTETLNNDKEARDL
eukprot:CAMPEP_0176117684 /NCGR_PEP_ID=MMETSP0120_2-20121206/59126_1 /TAXON_ID=160619 /ORGANISM="Kryptoperidinium foliaceum, Strain CCMP 1326" /LENGTH=77 /DNA_ID=CAMNT_0017451985 /DNA_START=217 /DNA_END=447 /DNA_ORIENTATION=+